jgi:ABC-type Fe3+-siderophore transport system permease subunit
MIENDDLMKIDTQSSEGLSDAQEKVLAILPIPSAILSILGSATILYMSLKTRKERKWTPYTRLLIGMSVSDIISSVTLGVAAFLRPRENQRVWMFGNDATCSAIGFLTQFSYSGLFYNAMLSFYFLLSARFHLTNEYIARKFEPFMHFLSLMFPLVTAIVGAGMGVYSTTTFELG